MPIYDLTFTLRDDFTRETTRSFQVDAVDFDAASTGASAFASDYAALSMASILKFVLKESTEYTDVIETDANIDEGVTFSWQTTPSKKAPSKVPAPIKAIFNADGSVDLTHVAVSAYASHYLGGFVLISDGETATALLSGKLDK